MIEVCEENVYYKGRFKKKKRKRLFGFFVFLLVMAFLMFYSEYFVFGNLINVCSDTAYSYCTMAVNECVLDETVKGINYDDLITIEKNSSGDITLINTNSAKINYLNRLIAVKTQERLEKEFDKGIPVPLLAFTGIKFLSGYGRKVKYKSFTVSHVICMFRDEFLSVGINQTMHTVYIDVTCDYAIEFPLNRRENTCVTSVMMVQSLIVGKIPNIYLNKV